MGQRVIEQSVRQEIVKNTLETLGEEPLIENLAKSIQRFYPTTAHGYSEVMADIYSELEGLGPIAPLLEDIDISEILVNSFNQIFVEKNGKLQLHSSTFTNEITYKRFIRILLMRLERIADQRHPLSEGVLDDGTRVHVTLPPVVKHHMICFRKHHHKNWSLSDLLERKMFSIKQKDIIVHWVLEKKNILVCGPTGSGKTTLMRSLLNLVEPLDRVVTIEDTPELGLESGPSVGLLTREDPEGLVPTISLSQLLRNALRMRPDRIVVGEVRGEEALVLIDALATGHRGSMCTIHANTSQQALIRLETLISRAAPQWMPTAIRQMIFESVDCVIVVDKLKGQRQITELAEISSLESFGFLLNNLG